MALGGNYDAITGKPSSNGIYMTHKQAETTRYKYKQANMTQKQAIQQVLDEPQLRGMTVNLPTWLRENPQAQAALDTGTKKQSDWKKIIKQTELRNEYASKMKKSTPRASTLYGGFSSKAEQQAELAKAITQSQTEHTGAWMKIHSMQEPELPLAAESPVKQNDFLPPSETPQQIFDFTPINSGRIELNPSLPEPRNYYTSLDSSASAKSRINYITEHRKDLVKIGLGIAIAALVLILILRRRK